MECKMLCVIPDGLLLTMELMDIVTILTVVVASVWAIGQIKASTKSLGVQMANLERVLSKLSVKLDEHETRISHLEGAKT